MFGPAPKASAAALLMDDKLGSRIRTEISPRAKRISLRVDVAEGCIVLVRPTRASDKLVGTFLNAQRRWIEKHLETLHPKQTLGDGSTVALLGQDVMIRAAPDAKRGVWREGAVIHVSGNADHLSRRTRDFIKDQAKSVFAAWARTFAGQLSVKVARVAVRDTATRWGSCTRNGNLSLSWRLMLAPENVARYVVAHEVAHLKHMNHSPSFWRTVDTLIGDSKEARAWLRHHGASLHRIL
ncbi:MAG: M48 family metallopeptidase [Rhodospirillaceae bacterium]|nr:M48 family metallopeptidase [Rhodospirillaceae bacterium]